MTRSAIPILSPLASPAPEAASIPFEEGPDTPDTLSPEHASTRDAIEDGRGPQMCDLAWTGRRGCSIARPDPGATEPEP
jgi:hypothetical protein